ncbi:MAG: porin [Sulfuricurvum sp.]|nr:porin [Sulfuricurvum sp.]
MKRTIKLAVAAAVALTSTAAFATNGDHLIGVGAKSRGMGGVGIGMSHGAESALSNPANITSVKGTEVSFGGTIFMPDVETNMGAGFSRSKADLSVIPAVSVASKLNDNFYIGVGMYGVAGMGTDYRQATGMQSNMNMVTNLQLMQFAVPMAYKVDGLSIGIAPVLQYGSLDINYDTNGTTNAGGESQTQGVAQDFGMGYNIGLSYETSGLTVGASYKSAITMEYAGQISKAMQQFGQTTYTNDKLEQPAEIGFGASYKIDGHTFAADYKRIKWSDAKGYEDFKWEDQNVYMLGYQYAQDSWALRAGYNYAKSPISEQSPNGAGSIGALRNVFNLLGFPAIVERHYTLGGTYEFSKTVSADLAYVYAPTVKNSYAYDLGNGASTITTNHGQDAVTAQVNFKF